MGQVSARIYYYTKPIHCKCFFIFVFHNSEVIDKSGSYLQHNFVNQGGEGLASS